MAKLEEFGGGNFCYAAPVEFDCSNCGKSSYNLKACGNCLEAHYCDGRCQRDHWPEHRKECNSERAQQLSFKGGRMVETDSVPEDDEEGGVLVMNRDDCPKNGYNKHCGFIPVKEFELSHLPEALRTQEIVEYVKAEADMTVRVLVKFTSMERPATDKHAADRGKRSSRYASGLFLLDNASSFQSKPCPVKKCHRTKDLGPEHDIFEGDLKIFTNKHVLFNEEEKENTVVDFFFDDEDTSTRVREYATTLFYTSPTSDKTFFKVTVHNKDLFDKLHQLDLKRAEKFLNIPPDILHNWAPNAILISHPHGWPKRISVGKIVKVQDENVTEETVRNSRLAGRLQDKWFASLTQDDYQAYMDCLRQKPLPLYKMWYDPCTCQGSSGGQILLGGCIVSGVRGPYMSIHVGYDVEAKLNFFKTVQFSYGEDRR